jgi:hypothetical protein
VRRGALQGLGLVSCGSLQLGRRITLTGSDSGGVFGEGGSGGLRPGDVHSLRKRR